MAIDWKEDAEAAPPRSAPDVIVLNGASSSGKTTLAVAPQDLMDESWLIVGIDTLISALPLALLDIHADATVGAHPRERDVRDGGISFDANFTISVGAEFQHLEAVWLKGLSAMAGAGTRLILDQVFLDGVRSQERFRRALAGRHVVWIGVTCDAEVANQRERDRGDRVIGAFERQSSRVHDGADYDLVVDTLSRPTNDVAQEIVEHIRATS